MLQQTQVATVLPYYKEWLRRFPNFRSLARASESEVLRAWQGLGYYARARNLHATAKLIVDRHRGRFPKSLEQIRNLPGVGNYTAHAVATFAFDQAVPIVETNSARVLARLFNLQLPIDSSRGQSALWNTAASLVPANAAAIYNSALLDLGALICLPHNPKCAICPVKQFCRATNPESLPIKRSRPATERLIEKHALTIRHGRILLEQSQRRWRGMWILPSLNGHSNGHRSIYKAIFPFTNHQITLQIFPRPPRKIDNGAGGSRATSTGKPARVDEPGRESINRAQRWFSKAQVASLPIPSPHRRAIEQLFPAA